jgi:uncharacterized membrane protein YgcG
MYLMPRDLFLDPFPLCACVCVCVCVCVCCRERKLVEGRGWREGGVEGRGVEGRGGGGGKGVEGRRWGEGGGGKSLSLLVCE